MAQMVLPQTPPPGDAGRNTKDPASRKSGDSQFDRVSQAEEKRMARKQADSRRHADNADDKAQRADRKNVKDQQGAAPPKAEKAKAEKAAEKKPESRPDIASDEIWNGHADDPVTVGIVSPDLLSATQGDDQTALFAFTGSQSMASQNTGGPLFAGNGGPGSESGAAGGGIIKGMLMMALGKSETVPGKTTSVQFSELMAPQSGQELLRTPDPTALISQRVATATDLPLQQQAALNGRVPPEGIPLKGYTTSVDVPVGQAEWGDKVMGKLTWLTANKLSVAEIHLTPPDMGPMEVRVQVQQDQTSITVHAANPAVRDQLELHSHRLRDMLSEQGLNLENFDVADSPRQQTGEQAAGEEGGNNGSGPEGTASGDGVELAEDSGNVELSWSGEVDIFA